MILTDKNHHHKYDKNGKQLCCTQQEKIYTNAGAKHLLKEGHSEDDGHDQTSVVFFICRLQNIY